MDTVFSAPATPERPLPEWYVGNDLRTAACVVERFLRYCTDPGDTVLDPFAGFGSTLVVAEAMDRDPWGIEYEPDRVDYVRDRIDQPDRIRHGDARSLSAFDFPPVDCCFTSPPYTTEDSAADPFRNYEPGGRYDQYLDDLDRIVADVATLLAPGGYLVLQVSNLRIGGVVTTLAWDVATVARRHLDLETEVVIQWEDGPKYGYDHGYGLVFRNDADQCRS